MIDRMKISVKKLADITKASTKLTNIIPEFARHDRFQLWVIVIGMSILISLLLMPRFHFTTPKYQVGFIAFDDVKADRDFLVEEKASTEQKRTDAIHNIKSIYDYDGELEPSLRENMTKAFAASAEAVGRASDQTPPMETPPLSDKNILAQIRQEFRKTLGITLSNEELHILMKYRFSREVAEKIIRLIQVLYETELISNVAIPEQDLNRGIIVRNVKTQSEEEQTDLSSIRRMEELETSLLRRANAIFREDR
jgi:cyclic-di-AMP phosphodiesterase PgpH